MGYRPSKKVYRLEFADFPGLEVTAAGTSLGKLLHMSSLNVQINEPDETKRMEVFNMFAGCLIAWNIEHPALEETRQTEEGAIVCANCGLVEGQDMPCNVTSLLCLELGFIMRIIFGWMAAIARVSIPKELALSNGGNDIEEAMMRLVQHQNLLTLPTPNLS